MGDWFEDLFGFNERGVKGRYDGVCSNFEVEPGDGGHEVLLSRVNNRRFAIGKFSTPSLAELRANNKDLRMDGKLSVSFVAGDVSVHHGLKENRLALFQAASQFNCLEFVGPKVVPEDGITDYVYDKTQGPACSIACGPATVFRNYFAPVDGPDGRRTGQRGASQINTLAEVSEMLGNTPNGRYFEVTGGYTMATDKGLAGLNEEIEGLGDRREEVKGALRVGLHEDVQVTSTNWGTCRIPERNPETLQLVTQVFSSACSVAYSRNDRKLWEPLARLVLEATYEATMWAALKNAARHGGQHGSKRVFLTAVGGGVFGNSMGWVCDAMDRAFEKFKTADLDVKIVWYAPPIDERFRNLAARFQPCHTNTAGPTAATESSAFTGTTARHTGPSRSKTC
jgi:hypothetical protein